MDGISIVSVWLRHPATDYARGVAEVWDRSWGPLRAGKGARGQGLGQLGGHLGGQLVGQLVGHLGGQGLKAMHGLARGGIRTCDLC